MTRGPDSHTYIILSSVLSNTWLIILYPAIPPKVDEAFKAFRYVPYTSLTPQAKLRATREAEEFVLNASGSFTAKGLDRRNERSISVIDWNAASQAAEERIRFHHGDTRADAFAAHHKLVMSLSLKYGWEVAVDYDISQRELVANAPSHDISSLDMTSLMIICSARLSNPASAQTSYIPNQSSPSKRTLPPSDRDTVAKKRQRTYCFRCGASGHFPSTCKAEVTSAGQPPARVGSNDKSNNLLLTSDGRQFCFDWARNGSCNRGDNCLNAHSCSLCGDASHGAGRCKHAARV